VKLHQPGPSSLSTLDLNANINNGCRRRTGDDISSLPVLCTGELKMQNFISYMYMYVIQNILLSVLLSLHHQLGMWQNPYDVFVNKDKISLGNTSK
jgi:hypothetical protein